MTRLVAEQHNKQLRLLRGLKRELSFTHQSTPIPHLLKNLFERVVLGTPMGEILRQRLRQKKFESPAHEALLALLVTASQLESEMDRMCADHGISLQQYNILRILRGSEADRTLGKSCGEIAERMIDRSPDVTRRIDSLVKAGLVERDRSEEDRRVVMTRITKKGLALLDKMQPEMTGAQERILGSLSAKDCQELTRLCEALLSAI